LELAHGLPSGFCSVGSESSCPVFVAHHLSASGLSNLAGSEAVDETSCWGGVAHAAAGATLSAFLVSFFVRPEDRFFVPTCACSRTARADAVKAGRRCAAAARSAVARPRLDGGEHGVTLRAVGTSAISTPCALYRAIQRGPWNTASVPSGYSRTLTRALT
jgi:hypothetical protein